MKPGRRWAATQEMGRIALVSLATWTLAISAASRADGAAAGSAPAAAANPAAAATDAPARQPGPPSTRASRRRQGRQLTAAQGIDVNVRRLTRGLKLDGGQQEKLRQILTDQHRQIVALRSGNNSAAQDVTGTALAIYDQTKARIRAILNDEQKKKYSADVPRQGLAPSQADLKHWMDLQESKRREEQAAEPAK